MRASPKRPRAGLILLSVFAGSACVPDAAPGTHLANRITFVDGGFDNAGNPVDGGVIVAPPDGGPSADGGGPPPPPHDGGTQGPPDATVVNVVYDECPDRPHPDLSAPIRVSDATNRVERRPAVTGFLVPLALEEEVYSLNSLIVLDEGGQRLPAQFEVLSRWGSGPADCGAPIRYAYAHVNAVPPAGGEAAWRVASDAENPGESTTLTLAASPEAWVIDTGVARFTVRRDTFQGLSRVEVPDGAGGFAEISRLEPGASGFRIDHSGEKGVTAQAPWRLELERRGPQVVTVAARGFYAAPGGPRDLGYTIRLHFYAGSGVVRVDHTYLYGEVEGWGATQVTNRTRIERAWMQVPLTFPAAEVVARADTQTHPLGAAAAVQVEQGKRTPDDDAVRYAVRVGGEAIENGQWADHPHLDVVGNGYYARGTLARMAWREPQALAWNPQANALELEFTSTPIWVGGARGIWTIGALDFGVGAPPPPDSLQLHAERPLLGAPRPEYVNGTRTIGPYAVDGSPVGEAYAGRMREIHERTRDYLRDLRVTGIQLWPDLPRDSCFANFDCEQARNWLHEGGDNNYWNWSKPGIDEFFRTGNNDFLYDFSLGEARTYAETLVVRTDHDRVADSSVMGLAACYGDSRGYSGDYREGLNHRRDRCVPDYSYDKTQKVAYLATADRRFVDFFEEAGESVVNAFGAPPRRPDPYLEVDLSRLSEQRLEILTDGAEFAQDPEQSAALRGKLSDYVNSMLGRVLIDGHHCYVSGSGYNDATETGQCDSNQAWMMPVGVEWAMRTARFLRHDGLQSWVVAHGQRVAANHAVLDGDGLPDFSRAGSAWRTNYGCGISGNGVDEGSCRKYTSGENNLRFYANGLMAFLNVFGVVLAADASDPHRICAWLPEAYVSQLDGLGDSDINYRIWGKSSGQAFGMAAEAAGALSMCP